LTSLVDRVDVVASVEELPNLVGVVTV